MVVEIDVCCFAPAAVPFRNSDLGIGVAWVPVAPAEPPYLFVQLFDSRHCGPADCTLFGFRQTGTGWHKMLEFFETKIRPLLDKHGFGRRSPHRPEPTNVTHDPEPSQEPLF